MQTSESHDCQLPAWSPRLRKPRIAQLYKSSGCGILDEELTRAQLSSERTTWVEGTLGGAAANRDRD